MMRVATYNLLKGGTKRVHWLKMIAEHQVDLLLAQESGPQDHYLSPLTYPDLQGQSVWDMATPNRWGSAIFAKTGAVKQLHIPRFNGWVVGAEITGLAWRRKVNRPLTVFSVHVPYGQGGYVKQMHALLDEIVRLAVGKDVIIGGDFNLLISNVPSADKPINQRNAAIQARLTEEFGLMNCWQKAHPGQPPAQTLRWTGNRTIPYHCDGIFAPAHWRTRLRSCSVLSGAEWDRLSDHNPVIVTFSD
jgi:endonuclease/exonuclease/phosphatase family metal-dependent hydrolase